MQLKTEARKGVAGGWGPDKCVVAPGRQQRGGCTQHHLEAVQGAISRPAMASRWHPPVGREEEGF